MAEKLRIVLADDHAATRLGIRRALERGGLQVVAEASDAAGAVRAAREHRPDICLLDVYMPGGGLTAASDLAEIAPATHVVMLSVSDSDEDVFESLRAGASGYLPKDTDPAVLAQALRSVVDGEAPLPRALTARLIVEFRRRARERQARDSAGTPVTFSAREAEVLELLRDGLTTKQIAYKLAISPVTVRRHISEILSKLQVTDRQAALRLTADPAHSR
jgi:DNA-binding NarL/FixJ family response regulator